MKKILITLALLATTNVMAFKKVQQKPQQKQQAATTTTAVTPATQPATTPTPQGLDADTRKALNDAVNAMRAVMTAAKQQDLAQNTNVAPIVQKALRDAAA